MNYKLGDKVIFNITFSEFIEDKAYVSQMEGFRGEEGTIVRVSDDRTPLPYIVDFGGKPIVDDAALAIGGTRWWIREKHLKPATESHEAKEGFISEPFDLDRALKGGPVWTRNGSHVEQLHLFETDDPDGYELAGILKPSESPAQIQTWTRNGKFFTGGVDSHNFDLFMKVPKPKTKTVTKWLRTWQNKDTGIVSGSCTLHDTEQEARENYYDINTWNLIVTPVTFEALDVK